MKNFKIKISSKNKKEVEHFYYHLFKRKSLKHNFKSIKKYTSKKKNTKWLTILKAPHVYKTAQEQFQYKIFKKKIELLVTNYKKFLYLLKKIKFFRFFEVNIQLKLEIQKQQSSFLKNFFKKSLKVIFLNIFLYNVKTKNHAFFVLKKNNSKLFFEKEKACQKYMKVFDIYGEKFLNSKSIY